jgi:transposase
VECPRFRGHLSAWSAQSDLAERIVHHATGSNFQKPCTSEFRREAVALYRGSGGSLKEIASDLGVSSESLRIWVKQAAVDAGEAQGISSEERDELRRLRRQVKVLEQEREILKKAAAFFARESETR